MHYAQVGFIQLGEEFILLWGWCNSHRRNSHNISNEFILSGPIYGCSYKGPIVRVQRGIFKLQHIVLVVSEIRAHVYKILIAVKGQLLPQWRLKIVDKHPLQITIW